MTREEAIELLEERKKFNRTMQRGWEQSEGVTASGKTVNTASFAKQHKDEADALDIALTALRPVSRELVERVWRGEWERIVDPYGKLEGFICKCGTQTYSASNFCPHCGGAKTDEAVEMVVERMEALKDGKDD